MSLNSFKEILKPCSSQSQSINPKNSTTITNPRKPPKSSLSQQLLRLQDHDDYTNNNYLIPTKLFKQQRSCPDVEFEDKHQDQDERQENRFRIERPNNKLLLDIIPPQVFDPTGPYEPLLLSESGHNPVVQVNY